MTAKQKQVIEALMFGAVAFPPRFERAKGVIEVVVPTTFVVDSEAINHLELEFVCVDVEGKILSRRVFTFTREKR